MGPGKDALGVGLAAGAVARVGSLREAVSSRLPSSAGCPAAAPPFDPLRVPRDALGVGLAAVAVARVGSLRVVGSSSVVVPVSVRRKRKISVQTFISAQRILIVDQSQSFSRPFKGEREGSSDTASTS